MVGAVNERDSPSICRRQHPASPTRQETNELTCGPVHCEAVDFTCEFRTVSGQSGRHPNLSSPGILRAAEEGPKRLPQLRPEDG